MKNYQSQNHGYTRSWSSSKSINRPLMTSTNLLRLALGAWFLIGYALASTSDYYTLLNLQ